MPVLALAIACLLAFPAVSPSLAPNAGFLDLHELQALQYNVVIDARPIREEAKDIPDAGQEAQDDGGETGDQTKVRDKIGKKQ